MRADIDWQPEHCSETSSQERPRPSCPCFHGDEHGLFALWPRPYLQTLPSKPIELPPQVAKAFARDTRAFFKAKNQLKQDEIAARQLHALWAFQSRRDKKLRLADVKEMFWQMKNHA